MGGSFTSLYEVQQEKESTIVNTANAVNIVNKVDRQKDFKGGMNKLSICSTVQNDETTKLLWTLWYEIDQLPLQGMTNEKTSNYLRGYSWAALRTNFSVKRLMFDAGLSSNITADYIFLTHGHSDHSASLYFHTLTKEIIIYAPIEIVSLCETLLQTTFQLSDFGKPFDLQLAKYKLVGVKPGDKIEIIHDGKPHLVYVYNNDHSVPCVSYGICESKKRVKAEYQYLIEQNNGSELGRLRKEGIIVDEISYIPRFVYVGDTSEKVFDDNPELFKYRDIIVECTFLFDQDLDQATATKHCHWTRLRKYIISHPECRFILYHFSLRYSPHDIKLFFAKDGPNYEKNIFPWINS